MPDWLVGAFVVLVIAGIAWAGVAIIVHRNSDDE